MQDAKMVMPLGLYQRRHSFMELIYMISLAHTFQGMMAVNPGLSAVAP
jgi:hypothetical protein